MKKILITIFGFLSIVSVAHASILGVQSGGTGASTLTGCLTGNGINPITGTGSACGSGGTNFFTNSSATTSLITGTILNAPTGTFGILNATSTTATSTFAHPIAIIGAGTSTFAGGIIATCFATSTGKPCIVPGSGSGGGGVTALYAGYGLNVTPSTGNVTAALNLSSSNNWNVLQTFPQVELNPDGEPVTPWSTFQMDYNAGGEVGGNQGKFTIGSDSGSWGQLQEYSPNAGEVSNVFCSDCIQNGDGTLSNVNGDSDTTFAFGVASFDGDTSHFNIGSNGTGGVVFGVDGDASSTMPGYDGDAGMILLPNQNNCNGPTDALSTDGIGGVFCNTSLSDQRLKKNIISLDASSSLAELMLLNPVTYNWNDSYYTTPTGEHDGISSTTPQLGLLAQQVQTLFPSLVQGTTSTTMEVVLKRNDGGKVIGTTTEQVQNYLSVDYVHMIPVLISAIQEQQTEVKQLQATIASTDSRLDVDGTLRLEGSSTVTTSSIGGAIVGLGCDTATTSVDTSYGSTTVFVTTPQTFPGAGLFWQTYLSATGVITTEVCSDVTVTPVSSIYNIKILK